MGLGHAAKGFVSGRRQAVLNNPNPRPKPKPSPEPQNPGAPGVALAGDIGGHEVGPGQALDLKKNDFFLGSGQSKGRLPLPAGACTDKKRKMLAATR